MSCATGLTSPTPGSRERRPPSTSAWTRTTTTGTSPSPTMRKLLTSRRGRGTSPRSTRARTMCSRGATTASSTPAREASQNESNVLLLRLFLTSNLLNWLGPYVWFLSSFSFERFKYLWKFVLWCPWKGSFLWLRAASLPRLGAQCHHLPEQCVGAALPWRLSLHRHAWGDPLLWTLEWTQKYHRYVLFWCESNP